MIGGVSIDVAVVQLVEPPIVIRKVTGSNPVGHPFNKKIIRKRGRAELHFPAKEEAHENGSMGSNPIASSKFK